MLIDQNPSATRSRVTLRLTLESALDAKLVSSQAFLSKHHASRPEHQLSASLLYVHAIDAMVEYAVIVGCDWISAGGVHTKISAFDSPQTTSTR
jgi:hypothetical protein